MNNHVLLNKPPTLYAILNSIVNFDNENPVKITDLASSARSQIFDFDYPLTKVESKEKFETMILNHFIHRRIGFETVTAFKIHLNVKLNEIMPIYNKMFEMLDGWDLFNDTESETRTLNNYSNNNVKSNANTTNINDNRFSDNPEGMLENVRDAKYVTEYTYNQTNNHASSETKGTSDATEYENITRTRADKIKIYTEFMKNRSSIYGLIFKELDTLFYGLV